MTLELILKENQKLFFTSDTHFGHKNICRGVSSWDVIYTRDYLTIDEMNNELLVNINETVQADDVLFHLGDWSFGGYENIVRFREQIKCNNLYLILGNHDHHIEKNKNNVQSLFSGVYDGILRLKVRYEDQPKRDQLIFILCHYPLRSWEQMGTGSMHLYGHVHSSIDQRIGLGRSMDVGVDGNYFKPIEMADIVRVMEKQPIVYG